MLKTYDVNCGRRNDDDVWRCQCGTVRFVSIPQLPPLFFSIPWTKTTRRLSSIRWSVGMLTNRSRVIETPVTILIRIDTRSETFRSRDKMIPSHFDPPTFLGPSLFETSRSICYYGGIFKIMKSTSPSINLHFN